MGSVTNISPDVASDLIPGYASLSLRSRYSANIGRQSYVVHARGGIAKGGTEPLFRSTSPGKILRDTLSPRLVCPLGLVCLADSPLTRRERQSSAAARGISLARILLFSQERDRPHHVGGTADQGF